ncbi:hypothetical protein CFP56_043632 [Quercus suber]|uniref:Uncharacterized protein n=1 Tax=Quercus suber TaxID=58331 RepID=A0AAW0LGX9_QUESU
MTSNYMFNISFVNNQDEITIMYAQSAKKNGLTQKKRMLTILGVSVAIMFLLVVSVVYWFVMNKKKGKEV